MAIRLLQRLAVARLPKANTTAAWSRLLLVSRCCSRWSWIRSWKSSMARKSPRARSTVNTMPTRSNTVHHSQPFCSKMAWLPRRLSSRFAPICFCKRPFATTPTSPTRLWTSNGRSTSQRFRQQRSWLAQSLMLRQSLTSWTTLPATSTRHSRNWPRKSQRILQTRAMVVR